jgi:hypothetical protein
LVGVAFSPNIRMFWACLTHSLQQCTSECF